MVQALTSLAWWSCLQSVDPYSFDFVPIGPNAGIEAFMVLLDGESGIYITEQYFTGALEFPCAPGQVSAAVQL